MKMIRKKPLERLTSRTPQLRGTRTKRRWQEKESKEEDEGKARGEGAGTESYLNGNIVLAVVPTVAIARCSSITPGISPTPKTSNTQSPKSAWARITSPISVCPRDEGVYTTLRGAKEGSERGVFVAKGGFILAIYVYIYKFMHISVENSTAYSSRIPWSTFVRWFNCLGLISVPR